VTAAVTGAALGLRAFWSSVFSLVAAAADSGAGRDRDRWFATSGMIQNAGFAVGGLTSGALLLLPGRVPFLVALALNAVSFLVSGWLFRHDDGRTWPDVRYLVLIAANTLFAVCSMLLAIGLPVYALDVLHAPGWLIGPLLALVTILGATGQGIGVRATRSLRRPVVLALAGLIWTAWGLLTAALTMVAAGWLIAGLVLACVLYAVAELLHAPTSMALAADQAPAGSRDSHLSMFQYSFAIAGILTPLLFGTLVGVGAALPWLAAAVAAALAAVLTLVVVPRSGADRDIAGAGDGGDRQRGRSLSADS
jgi:MFS family permease